MALHFIDNNYNKLHVDIFCSRCSYPSDVQSCTLKMVLLDLIFGNFRNMPNKRQTNNSKTISLQFFMKNIRAL